MMETDGGSPPEKREWWKSRANWNGWPLRLGQYPVRPWWDVVGDLATRTDSVSIYRAQSLVGLPPRDPTGWTYRVAWGQTSRGGPEDWTHAGTEWSGALAAYDAFHPLTVPPPFAGQVWVGLEGTDREGTSNLVRRVFPVQPGVWLVWLGGATSRKYCTRAARGKGSEGMIWPPSHMGLADGAFAPWGPAARGGKCG